MSKIQMGRWFDEEYILGYIDPNDQNDLWGSSSDRDVHHEHTRRRGSHKYLRESCYHHIECIAIIFLAAFMWKRPLNSVALATTTHKKPRRVSDGIDTQVRAQIINKCRIKMVQRELYNVRNLPWGGDRKKEREHCSHSKLYL